MKAECGTRAGYLGFDVAIARRRVGYERIEQLTRGYGYLRDCMIKGRLVGLGRLAESAQFPHELNCRSANLFLSRRWFEVMQSPDVATHLLVPSSVISGPTRRYNVITAKIQWAWRRSDRVLFLASWRLSAFACGESVVPEFHAKA